MSFLFLFFLFVVFIYVLVPMMVPETTSETLKHKINPSLDLAEPQTVHVLLYTPGQAPLLVNKYIYQTLPRPFQKAIQTRMDILASLSHCVSVSLTVSLSLCLPPSLQAN